MEFNGTFIVAFISFIVFIFIMNWILYKPIDDIVSKRKKIINDNYNEAKENTYKSAIVLQERIDKLNNVRIQNKDEYVKHINNAKDKKDSSIRLAKEQSATNVIAKTNFYNEESKRAKEILKNDVVKLARMISDKFIQTPEDTEIDPALVNKIIQG